MAVTAGDYLRPARSLISGSIPTITCLETSGQTFKPGELVTIASGKVKLVTTTSNVFLTTGSSATQIFGVTATTGKNISSANPSWNNSSDTVGIIPAVPWMVWEVAVVHGTTASSVVTATDMGEDFALARSTSNKIWYLKRSDTSQICCTVVGFKDAIGTQNGHVYITFLGAEIHPAWSAD